MICQFTLCNYIQLQLGIHSVPYPRVQSVCPGEQLTLTCTANHSTILTWTVVVLLTRGNITETRSVPFMGISLSPFVNNGVRFNFIRTSNAGTLPLISELLIDRVNININGTEIQCSPVNDELDHQMTFIIHVKGGRVVS